MNMFLRRYHNPWHPIISLQDLNRFAPLQRPPHCSHIYVFHAQIGKEVPQLDTWRQLFN